VVLSVCSMTVQAQLSQLNEKAKNFEADIIAQLVVLKGTHTNDQIAEQTIKYSESKIEYFGALREAEPELFRKAIEEKRGNGKEKYPELDTFLNAFPIVGEVQEKAADAATEIRLDELPSSDLKEQAKQRFKQALKVEAQFHQDFDGMDSASLVGTGL
jgi:hypothetical protein